MAKVLHKKHDLKRPLILMAAVITIAFSCCCFVSQKDEALAKLDTNGLGAFPSCLSDSSYTSVLTDDAFTLAMESVWSYDYALLSASSNASGGFLYIGDEDDDMSAELGCEASIASGSLFYKFDHWSYNLYNDENGCWAPYTAGFRSFGEEVGGRALFGYSDDEDVDVGGFRDLDPGGSSGQLAPGTDQDVFRANYAQLVPLEIEDDDEGTGLDADSASSKYLFIYNPFTDVTSAGSPSTNPDELDISYYPGGEKSTDSNGDVYYKIGLHNKDSRGDVVDASSSYFCKNYKTDFSVKAKSGYVLTGFRIENQLDSSKNTEITITGSSDGEAQSPTTIDNPKIIPIFDEEEAPEPVIERIEVTSMPTKTSYKVGDSFDPTGMKVTAYYAKGNSQTLLENLLAPAATKDVTNKVTFTPKTFTKAGAQNVTISYTEGKVTKTVNLPVNVAEASPTPTPAPSDGQTVESVEAQAPQTGDIAPVYALLGVAAASLCVVVVCARRRKQTQ